MSTLNNDLCRQKLKTDQDIPQAQRNEIVDIYSLKLLRSGYNLNVTREIIISGLRSYQRKVVNAREAGQNKGYCLFNVEDDKRRGGDIDNSWLSFYKGPSLGNHCGH